MNREIHRWNSERASKIHGTGDKSNKNRKLGRYSRGAWVGVKTDFAHCLTKTQTQRIMTCHQLQFSVIHTILIIAFNIQACDCSAFHILRYILLLRNPTELLFSLLKYEAKGVRARWLPEDSERNDRKNDRKKRPSMFYQVLLAQPLSAIKCPNVPSPNSCFNPSTTIDASAPT